MATFPSKVNYATGDILTATNMNDVGNAINTLNGAQYAAGKNAVINGDFGIWQRGTSVNIGVGSYWADRFSMDMVAAVPTGTASRQTFTPGTAPVAGYEGAYFGRVNITANNNCTQFYVFQKIEDVRTFAGQTVTLSAWLKADATVATGVYLVQNFGSGGSSAVSTTVTSASDITNGWVRYTWTATVPSIAGKTIGTGSSLEVRFTITNAGTSYVRVGTYDFWGIQLEAAQTASPFQTATGTKQGELAACQRYYFKSNAQDAMGTAQSATQAEYVLRLPVTMRTTPTISIPATYSFDAFGLGTKTGTSNTAGLLQSNALDFYTSGSSGLTVGTRTAYNDAVSVSAEL